MPTGLGVGLEYIKYTVKINMLYLIQKKKMWQQITSSIINYIWQIRIE